MRPYPCRVDVDAMPVGQAMRIPFRPSWLGPPPAQAPEPEPEPDLPNKPDNGD